MNEKTLKRLALVLIELALEFLNSMPEHEPWDALEKHLHQINELKSIKEELSQ